MKMMYYTNIEGEEMIKVLFVCLGNICRSPMAEFMFKDMVKKKGLEEFFLIQSAGTSDEEHGNPVHYGAKEKLNNVGISVEGKYAVQLKRQDYKQFDYIIAMEQRNIRDIYRIVGADKENKVYRLLDFSNNPRDIADPWYTGNFEVTYNDILEGLSSFLHFILTHEVEGMDI